MNRRVGLTTQLLAGVLLPLVVFGFVLHAVQRRTLAVQLSVSSRARSEALAHAYAAACLDAVLTSDQAGLDRVTTELTASRSEIAYAFIADPTGAILAHSFSGGFPVRLLPLAMASGTHVTELCTDLGRLCHAAVPILDGTPGSAHVGLSMRPDLEQMRTMLMRFDLMFGAFGSLVCLLVVLTQSLSVRRLRELANRIGSMAPLPTPSEPPLPVEGPREVAELAAAFNTVRAELRTTHGLALQSERLATAGRFTAGLVHELNNPLASVHSFVRGLAAGKVPPEKMPEYIALAQEAMDRVFLLTNRMVKSAISPVCEERRRLDVAEIARDALENTAPLARTRKVELKLHVPGAVPPAAVCEDLIRQALENLLVNAVEASEPGGRVDLFVQQAGQAVVLEVEDRGCGMPPELGQRIGEPFFTTKGGGSGLGLGLFLVGGALRHCGGSMQIRSEPGRGTSVRIQIPLSAEETE